MYQFQLLFVLRAWHRLRTSVTSEIGFYREDRPWRSLDLAYTDEGDYKCAIRLVASVDNSDLDKEADKEYVTSLISPLSLLNLLNDHLA